jgi:hypothetical protein
MAERRNVVKPTGTGTPSPTWYVSYWDVLQASSSPWPFYAHRKAGAGDHNFWGHIFISLPVTSLQLPFFCCCHIQIFVYLHDCGIFVAISLYLI